MAMDRVYANLEMKNDTSTIQPISLIERRDPKVLEHPEKYYIGIDRFTIHKAWLPVFESWTPLKVRIIKISDSTYDEQTLDFSAAVDDDNLLWNIEDFITVWNSAVHNAYSAMGGGGTAPRMTFNMATLIATIDYSLATSFSTTFYLAFNEPLYAHFHSFTYLSIEKTTTLFLLYTPSSPTTISTSDPIQMSPIDKIFIKTNRMPIIPEFSPSISANNNGQPTRNSDAIVTDFEFGGTNKYALNDINYTATSGQYRYHSMQDSLFNTIDLQFYYKTYSNNTFPLYIQKSGSCNVKLIFTQQVK